ncbi:leukemia inhibitory factor receptor [Nematolebias whitei]|uniref:leukemia inhibitory factor receptor n=1 Tax=Nematolebias whitei TaxID=451745 RepID=UPI001899F8AA|nr:leukemia inhibitory factor receptor [Nematolebias whitei]
MSGHGGQLMSLHSKSLFGCISQTLIFGLMLLVFYTMLSPHIRASEVSCRSKNMSAEYSHCGIQPDGVHDLVCFGKPKQRGKYCTWKPGKYTSKNTYTLITRQITRNSCYIFNNITKFNEIINKVFELHNMTVEVLENAHKQNCTKAVFKGSPKHLTRCDPPSFVSFSRLAGRLNMNVRWSQAEEKFINYFFARFKEVGSSSWNKPSVQSENKTQVRVENLNSSLMYVAQIQCATNDKCPQCPWSEDHIVQSELTTQPVITGSEETVDNPGRRWISVTWKFPAEEQHDGYKVTICKASGEAPQQQKKTLKPQIRLLLSYSAYLLNISAFNNASISPPASLLIPQQEHVTNEGDDSLNVNVHSSTSLTVSWKHDLIKQFVCYSVEWRKKGHSARYKSFYENSNNFRNLSHLPEPLEPYVCYRLTLNIRPYKDTCNIKLINNSEGTYGTTQFYFRQGTPVSAPTNISFSNKTLSSVVLQWSAVPEEDVRGFLLGYIIIWAEYHNQATVNNITLDQESKTYELTNLKSDTAYQVYISAFTAAGEGVRSAASFFKTHHDGNTYLIGIFGVIAVVGTLLAFWSLILKRLKAIMLPSIPNPGNSSAVKKIDRPGQLELLEAIATLQVEEWVTKSLQILEREDVNPAGILPSKLPLLRTSENQEDFPEITCNWTQMDTESTAGDNPPDDTADTLLNMQQSNIQSSPLTFAGDYTTMEMFQQLICQDTEMDATVTAIIEKDMDNIILKALRSDYVRQFSTSSPSDSDHMSTIL